MAGAILATSPFLALGALACPLGMGVMMWFMARGSRSRSSAPPGEQPSTLDELRREHGRSRRSARSSASSVRWRSFTSPGRWTSSTRLGCGSCAAWRAVRSASRFYRLSLALGAAGAGVLAVAVTVAVRSINLGTPSLARLLSACQAAVLSSRTATSAIVLAFTGVGLAVLSLAVRSLLAHYRAQRRVLSALPLLREITLRGTAVTVFGYERPKAFCAALLRPRIYLSSAAR